MAGFREEGVVVYRRTDGPDAIDAIDEHSRRLVDALSARGVKARYAADGLASIVRAPTKPSWVLLQYNPFRFGRRGFAPDLIRDALALRRHDVPLAIMVHEAWVPMTDLRTTLMGLWQRVQLRALLRLTDALMTSTEALAREIGHGAVHVPVASNITPVATPPERARAALGLNGRLVVALFGRAHPSRALEHAEAAIAALALDRGTRSLVVLNLGADAPPPRVPPGVELASPGRLDENELSLRLSASDVVLLPFTDGLSTRRTTLAAALAHGRPVIGLSGRNTDKLLVDARQALTLTPVGDPAAFAQAAVALSRDQRGMWAAGEAGRRLYETTFDWPVAAQSVAAILARI